MTQLKHIASLLALTLAMSATPALACPGDKAKDESKQSTPQKPNTSLRT